MGQSLELKITGLRTNPSPLDTKGGSLSQADNININSPNTAECRRGFTKYSDLFTVGSGKISSVFSFKDRIHAFYENTLSADDGSGTFSDYTGTFVVPDTEIGFRQATQQGALFFPTTAGVKRLDSLTGSPVDAGVPKGLNADYSLVSAGGDTITATSAVMYRIVWGYKDSNGKILLGSPSERVVATNSDADNSYDVTLTIYVPDGITTDYFYQIYRTANTGDNTIVPNEEAGLIYENNPTATDISNSYLTVTDQTPDSLIGATIYTAPTQEGILSSNGQPPYCKDMALYKNHMFYANCRTRHFLQLTMISVGDGSTISLQAGDIVTINSEAYTAVASGATHADGEFNVTTAGTVAGNIEATARDLIKAINLKTSNLTVYAYYTSGYDDLPGEFIIERRSLADTAFYAYITTDNTGEEHGNSFNPVLPEGVSTSVTSENDDAPNKVYVSKIQEPDAVPILNDFSFGSDQSNIIRAIALRDTLFIMKDDGTVWKLTGEDLGTFVVSKFDDTISIYGPKTAVVFNNQVFAMSSQGIVAISDSGIAVKSWDIEDKIIKYLSTDQYASFKTNAFAIAYESERKYIFCDGELKTWVYNSFTNVWTNWDRVEDAGVVNPVDNKLYLANRDGYIRKERKDYSQFDYADDSYAVTIVSSTGVATTTVEVSDTTNVAVGQSLNQGDYMFSRITAVETGGVLTVEDQFIWTDGAATVNDTIKCEMTWLPLYSDNPGMMKRFTELLVFFRDMNKNFTLTFKNNFDQATGEEVVITPTYTGNAYGALTYGEGVYGGGDSGSQEHRVFFPLGLQRALWALITFTTDRAFTKFSMNAASIIMNEYSQRFLKR